MPKLGLELTLVRQSGNYSPHQEVSPQSLSRTMISCIKAFVAFRAHRVFRRVPFREKVQETHEFNTELVWHIRHSYGT
eukprot:9217504-Pyramimonas_sp.AAC.1